MFAVVCAAVHRAAVGCAVGGSCVSGILFFEQGYGCAHDGGYGQQHGPDAAEQIAQPQPFAEYATADYHHVGGWVNAAYKAPRCVE